MQHYKINFNKIISFLMFAVLLIFSCLLTNPSHAQVVKSFQKISATQGGFTEAGGLLKKMDDFGESLDTIGDLDGDGVIDLVVGVKLDDDGGTDRGAVYILFMNTNGTVKQLQKISSTQGGFTGILDDGDWFGIGATGLGDLDGDGVLDIAVGAAKDDDGQGDDNGAVYILFLNIDGTVKNHQKISEDLGGLNLNVSSFGGDLEMLGDLNSNGVKENFLFVQDPGGFYILSLNNNGTVKTSSNRFTQSGSSSFGGTGALIGDLNLDGVQDIAVGAQSDNDGGFHRGSVWILFMNANGLTTKSRVKISNIVGNFTGQLEDGDEFGQSVSPAGDRNGDGIPDLIVGAEHADAPSCTSGIDNNCKDQNTGEVWILHLNRNGTVKSHELIRSKSENFTTIRRNSNFGQAVTYLGDLNGDCINDIAATADGDIDGSGVGTGALYILFLKGSIPSGGCNQPPVLAPIPNQTVTVNNPLIVNISATDDSGLPPLLSASGTPLMQGANFMDKGNGTGVFSWTPNSSDVLGSPYTITFTATENGGSGLSVSQIVTITVKPTAGGGSGNILGSLSPFPGYLNLTAQGTTDWTLWQGSINSFIRKAGVSPQISDYTLIGSETPVGSGTQATYAWTDGTPVVSGSNMNGLRVFNVGSGFRVNVPAGTTVRTLNFYVGAKNARGQFTARLSDNSANAYSILINQPSGLGSRKVTLDYRAASNGQTLTIEYTMETRYNSNLMGSQINLEAATLF